MRHLQILDLEIKAAQDRFALACTAVAVKYEIAPGRGDKLDIRTGDIIRREVA